MLSQPGGSGAHSHFGGLGSDDPERWNSTQFLELFPPPPKGARGTWLCGWRSRDRLHGQCCVSAWRPHLCGVLQLGHPEALLETMAPARLRALLQDSPGFLFMAALGTSKRGPISGLTFEWGLVPPNPNLTP